MIPTDQKAILQHYLRGARAALLWKLDGLSEYDVRRPMTPTGTNLLGLLKHVASTDVGYLGEVFGRPFAEPMPWIEDDSEDNADMWATEDESREQVLAFADRAWAHSDATVEALPLDATGEVSWWPPERRQITLGLAMVHVIAETDRHAGHADIVRELIDGAAGLRAGTSNLPPGDADWWAAYRDRVERAARASSS